MTEKGKFAQRINLLDNKKINKIELKNFIEKVSGEFLDLKEIYLFGSRFNGEPKENSDYDLVFIFEDYKKYLYIDGFEDVDKIYSVLRKHNLDIVNDDGKYKFHIFLEEPQLSDGSFLIWKKDN